MVLPTPTDAMKSSPTDHTSSLTSTLKANGRDAAVVDHVHNSDDAHSICTPLSQLKPGPSPRIKRRFPKPTSTCARTAVGVTVRLVAETVWVFDSVFVEALVVRLAGAFFAAAGFAGVEVAFEDVAFFMFFYVLMRIRIPTEWFPPGQIR